MTNINELICGRWYRLLRNIGIGEFFLILQIWVIFVG